MSQFSGNLTDARTEACMRVLQDLISKGSGSKKCIVPPVSLLPSPLFGLPFLLYIGIFLTHPGMNIFKSLCPPPRYTGVGRGGRMKLCSPDFKRIQIIVSFSIPYCYQLFQHQSSSQHHLQGALKLLVFGGFKTVIFRGQFNIFLLLALVREELWYISITKNRVRCTSGTDP